MKLLRKKLHSETGASLMLALLFLFFCLMVGALVLTAASANAGRTTRIEGEQQRYLTVESAALLLREDLHELQFVGSYDQVVTTTYWSETTENPETGEEITTTHSDSTTAYQARAPHINENSRLAPLFIDELNTLYQSGTDLPDGQRPAPPSAITYELTLDANDDDALSGVSAAVSVDLGSYDITVVLKDAAQGNTTKLHWRASTKSGRTFSTTGDNPRIDTTTYTTTVTWADAVITKGA